MQCRTILLPVCCLLLLLGCTMRSPLTTSLDSQGRGMGCLSLVLCVWVTTVLNMANCGHLLTNITIAAVTPTAIAIAVNNSNSDSNSQNNSMTNNKSQSNAVHAYVLSFARYFAFNCVGFTAITMHNLLLFQFSSVQYMVCKMIVMSRYPYTQYVIHRTNFSILN